MEGCRMKTALPFLVLLALASVAASQAVTGYGDLTWNSKYIWRGLNFVDGSVLQPSAWLSCCGFTGGVWGSMEMTDVNEVPGGDEREMKFTEVDLYLSYTKQLGPACVTFGVGDFLYPNTDYNSTAELSLVSAFGVPLTPVLSFYRDIKEADGLYMSLGVSKAIPGALQVSEAICVYAPVLSASIGYGNSLHNTFYYWYPDAAMADMTMNATLPISVGSSLYITPAAHYAMLMDSEIKDLFEEDTQFWGGTSITYYF
jgi:hypothetical protein